MTAPQLEVSECGMGHQSGALPLPLHPSVFELYAALSDRAAQSPWPGQDSSGFMRNPMTHWTGTNAVKD